ncbi:MAG: winged helix DNA-binding domain-containing protein [Anaerolineae bacterium]|jgi:hypothetical protein|nr:winged helix DNA-binding domain-containing protein [Anaerolineae bacterium]
MAPERISLATARSLALHCQGLDGAQRCHSGKEGVAQTIERLGYVQIDTIHVIQRAHHHVLWSRCRDYRPEMLHELLAADRRVFEWWTHAASYIPMSDYRFYAPRMGERALWSGQKAWREENNDVVETVIQRIRDEGALSTADFDAPEGHEGGSWWSGWKPAKRALEVLFNLGVVSVSERRKFERVYDLSARIIPEGAAVPKPARSEVEDFILRRAVGSLGVLPTKEIWWWRRDHPSALALGAAVEAGLITAVSVEGQGDEPWYAWTEALDAVDGSGPGPSALHILSPFDNLTIRRNWMELVFGFDYRLECYLPQEKRRYGYFALPILWGDRFIGRVDTKADRQRRTLIVRQLTFEPDFSDFDQMLPELAEELRAYAAFNGCPTVSIEQVSPQRLRELLTVALV